MFLNSRYIFSSPSILFYYWFRFPQLFSSNTERVNKSDQREKNVLEAAPVHSGLAVTKDIAACLSSLSQINF